MRAEAVLVLLAVAAACQPRWDGPMAALSNPDPAKRVEAVQQMARLGNPEELASLVYRANDPSGAVRAAIAQALGSLDNRPAADALATLVADSDESVQLAAVDSLARQRNIQAHEFLLLAYQRDGLAVRARVIALLKAGGGSPAEAVTAEAAALYAQYSKQLASSGAVRLMAAERLGNSGRPEAIERLTNYLAAESRSLALAAARGLGASGSPEAREPLEALLTEQDPALRLAGAEALGDLADPNAADALLRVLSPDDLVAQAALRSLIRLARLETERRPKPPEHARLLLCDAALASGHTLAVEAANAILAMQIVCPPDKWRSRLARGGDVAGALAAAAVIWSEKKGAPPAPSQLDEDGRSRLAPLIGSLLRSGSPQVRPLAARAAGALQLTALTPELERARKEAGIEVQRARQRWIGEPHPQDVGAGGTTADADSGPDVPSLFDAAPEAALKLWGEATAAGLRLSLPAMAGLGEMLARDPAPAARIAIARALEALPAEEQWTTLHPLLEDPEPDVRAAAWAKLAELDAAIGQQAGGWMLAELGQVTSESSISPLVDAVSRLPDLPGRDEALVAALERPETAPAAAAALARIGDPPAIAAIIDRLRRPYALALPELLAAAASRAASLTEAQAASAASACRALLFHPRPEVRAAAVRALFALSGPSAISEAFADIRPLAGDYDLRVRRAVAER